MSTALDVVGSISTQESPRHLGYQGDIASGYVILLDKRGPRVVAEDIGYTNEVKVDPSGKWLYVNETFGRKTSRFPIADDGSLGAKRIITEYGTGNYPDGMEFDQSGGVWISSIISNRVIRIAPDGTQEVMLEEVDEGHVARSEDAYLQGKLGRDHLDNIATPTLERVQHHVWRSRSENAYVGNLLDDCIYTFTSRSRARRRRIGCKRSDRSNTTIGKTAHASRHPCLIILNLILVSLSAGNLLVFYADGVTRTMTFVGWVAMACLLATLVGILLKGPLWHQLSRGASMRWRWFWIAGNWINPHMAMRT